MSIDEQNNAHELKKDNGLSGKTNRSRSQMVDSPKMDESMTITNE